MKETMIGDLKMHPQQLLEEGLRKELVRQISFAMHDHLQFSISSERSKKALRSRHQVFLDNLNLLARRVEGFRSAIIWLQDFLRIDGLDIYLQESTRVIWHSTK
jgi:WASH complex subunit strumpellin